MSNDYILKIKKAYTGDSCMQIMIPYDKNITIFDNNKILYHNAEILQTFENNYLSDERRHEFPYSNIPTHKIKIYGHTFNSFNILFDYNKPYIMVRDESVTKYMAIKSENGAFLISKDLEKGQTKNYEATREEVYSMFEKNDNSEILLIKPNGIFVTDKDNIIPTNKAILRKKIINNAFNEINNCVDFANKYGCKIRFICDNSHINLTELECFMKSLDLEKLINFHFAIDIVTYETIIKSKKIITNTFDEILIAKIGNEKIKLDLIELSYLGDDKYNLCSKNIPIDYDLEPLNILTHKIKKTTEPNISLKLNPEIKKDDIRRAKRLVKQRQKMIN